MGLGLLQVASVHSTLWKIFEDFEVRKGSFEKRSVEGPRKGCGQEVFGDVQNQRELNNTDHIARAKKLQLQVGKQISWNVASTRRKSCFSYILLSSPICCQYFAAKIEHRRSDTNILPRPTNEVFLASALRA